jgi:hypothetical protein
MSKTTGHLESRISQAIQKAVKAKIPGAVIRKRHVTMGVMGDPDLYGSLPTGIHFEIEVKRPGNHPTELQLQRLAEWRAAGAITGVAHSVEEALAILFRGVYEKAQ